MQENLPLSELCRDINMKLPDVLWAMDPLERYRRSRHTEDFATFDDEGKTYLYGVVEVPLAHTPGETFTWGLWLEVPRDLHDAYLACYRTEAAAALCGEGVIANDVPGYPDAMGSRASIRFFEDRRPGVTPLEGSLAAACEKGLSETEHRELDNLLFGDEEEDLDDAQAEDFGEDDAR